MLVYLAGPIDDVIDAHKWRDYVASEFAMRNILCYDPSRALWKIEGLCKEDKHKIMALNQKVIFLSDVIYVYLPSDEFTVGTSREIQLASMLMKPVIVVSDKPNMTYLVDCYAYKHHTNAMEKVYGLLSEWKEALANLS